MIRNEDITLLYANAYEELVRLRKVNADLLAALEAVADSFGQKMSGMFTVDEANALIKTREAIAKAKQQQAGASAQLV